MSALPKMLDVLIDNLLAEERKADIESQEVLRDARWQLMVIRAESVPEGRGPVFADPKALRRYLAKTRR